VFSVTNPSPLISVLGCLASYQVVCEQLPNPFELATEKVLKQVVAGILRLKRALQGCNLFSGLFLVAHAVMTLSTGLPRRLPTI
jgi:hypothetical protein